MNHFTYDLPKNYYFGAGQATFATPMAVAVLVAAIILIVLLPRRYAVVPLLLAGIFLPLTNNVVVTGFHFFFDRILLVAGWIRILIRKERNWGGMNSLDRAVLLGALAESVAFCILWAESGAVVNRVGFLFSVLGTYFLLRALIRDKQDVIRVIKVLAIVVIICAPLMLREYATQQNGFYLLGAGKLGHIRYGRVRATGPFAHSIIAGTFGAVVVPLFVGLWWSGTGNKRLAAAGILSSMVMMFTSASTTPVMALSAGVLALSTWPLHKKMRTIRWAVVLALIALELVMKSPVWFLIARLGRMLGGSGYHRAMLIDNFVRHFSDWWLIGTRNNAYWGWDMWDVDNAFVAAGFTGGLLGFILFLAVFFYGFRMIGAGVRVAQDKGVRNDGLLMWAIGAALFANAIAFFGIVYFDQSRLAWYALLAMIAVLPSLAPAQQLIVEESALLMPPSAPGGAVWLFNFRYNSSATAKTASYPADRHEYKEVFAKRAESSLTSKRVQK